MVTVISTFAGCGGSSLGYKWAGFKEFLAIEWEDNAVETFKLNFPEIPIWQRDICSVTGKEILDFCKIEKGELDVLDGSPPCQGFSTAGKRKVTDSRNDLFKEYSRLLKELQPKVFVMENVSGMIKGTMKGKFLEILTELKSCGYNVKCKLMNAMWYEVPQSRERLFFIGIRNDLNIKPSFPEPMKKFITLQKCIGHLENSLPDRKISEWLIKAYPELKNGIAKAFLKYKGTLGGSFSTILLKRNKPSQTLTKSEISVSGLLHYSQPRYLTAKELLIICSFPENFKYETRELLVNRLGNSVPPKMMFHIAKNIKDNILDYLELSIKRNGENYDMKHEIYAQPHEVLS